LAAIDLKSQLTALIKLQGLDTEIYGLRNEKEAKPQELKAMEAAFEAKKQNLAEIEKKALDLQKQRKERELELATNEESAKKLQSQLYSLKTNKEYQAMLQQIQDTKADGSVIEDKILILFDEADKIKKEVEQEGFKLKEEEKVFLEQKKKVEIRVKEIDDSLSQLDGQRKQIIPEVEPKMLAQYERILHSRDWLAIVNIKHDSCGGCHMSVSPQVVNLIKMYEHIITCEVCNRILYIQE